MKRINKLRLICVFCCLSFLVLGCNQFNNVFKTESPREAYIKEIKESPLAKNKIVQKWLAEGDSVLHNPVAVEVPFQTKMVYFSDEAHALAWQFSMPEGRTFQARLSPSDSTQQIFMDLFTLDNGRTTLTKSAKDSVFSYTLDEDQTFIVRIQAELLVNGSATLTLTDHPSMKFPVQDGKRADIGSFWGDPRDAGARKHKGVDIFADRGTPALAVANGWVTRTGNRGLGGKQVWLSARGKSIYYAHLDSINAHMGQKAQPGDTLGFVGNTGNARTTPTHLHFGIYEHGAINPMPFIDFSHDRFEAVSANPSAFNKWGRISATKANVRPLPSTKEGPAFSLSRNNPVKILAGIGDWYHIQLPDGKKGFIYHSLVEPTHSPIGSKPITPKSMLSVNYNNLYSTYTTDKLENIKVYGSYRNRKLAKFINHWVWVDVE